MFDFVQPLIGAALVLAAGFSLTTAFFRKDFDFLEKAVLSVVLGLVVPTLIIIFLNMGLGIKFSDILVYSVYVLAIVLPFAYLKFFAKTTS